MLSFEAADRPTMYFIGVTTTKSSIMKIFPLWARALGLENTVLKGIDLPLHAPVESYRSAVEFIRNDPLSIGALVTTHKLDLFAACKDMFDFIDPFAKKLEEVSVLSKENGAFCAYAKDPIASGLALEQFVPAGFWKEHGGKVLLLGAGGSSLAMSLYLSQEKFGANVPCSIALANRSLPRLDSARRTLAGLNQAIAFSFLHSPNPSDNDRLIGAMPPYSLIVNATGLGKDAPGSPTTDSAEYPLDSLVWEINYRGDLIFMDQAKRQEKAKNLHVEDGWAYFIYGWTQGIAEVFHVKIDGRLTDKLGEIAMDLK